MCHLKEDEDSTALKIDDLKTILKRAKKGSFQRLTIQTEQKIVNRNKMENNCKNISSDQLAKSHTRRTEHANKSETFREKLNIFE